MADDLTATLARIERHRARAAQGPRHTGLSAGGNAEEPEASLWALVHQDAPRLLAAVTALLKLADEWEGEDVNVDPEIALRETIRAALTGTGKEGSEDE